jgi:ribosomal protein S18 acetylase RimI-like enzyme
MAMVREGLERPEAEDPYQLLVAVDEDVPDAGPAGAKAPPAASRVIAYACFGMIPLTRGAYDLYWIAVHPDHQARGVGRALLRHCEQVIAAQGGRLIVVETSGRPDYEPTRRFYEKTMAYAAAARIRDFYQPGDDKIVYVKYLGEQQDGGAAKTRPG